MMYFKYNVYVLSDYVTSEILKNLYFPLNLFLHINGIDSLYFSNQKLYYEELYLNCFTEYVSVMSMICHNMQNKV